MPLPPTRGRGSVPPPVMHGRGSVPPPVTHGRGSVTPPPVTCLRLLPEGGFSFGRGFATRSTTRSVTHDQASGEDEEMETEDDEGSKERRQVESSQSKI